MKRDMSRTNAAMAKGIGVPISLFESQEQLVASMQQMAERVADA
ncbi:hypothetical protein [Ferviditalea candida]|uniref:Uncharacterized protein n=1 Tax=Ferviditalea candida TaxID=3108399 RepID=A0ABU5ZQP1_9BACL|nr:hypothetical protein [Paenibacillaceae bacterium T2]